MVSVKPASMLPPVLRMTSAVLLFVVPFKGFNSMMLGMYLLAKQAAIF